MKIEELYPTDEELKKACHGAQVFADCEDCNRPCVAVAKFAVDNAVKKIVEWVKSHEISEVLDEDDDNKNFNVYLVPVKDIKRLIK